MAEPGTASPGTFDVACLVPKSAVTAIDPRSLPGTLVADILRNMGIGELCVTTRVSRIGIVVTDLPPPKAVKAWDLVEVGDSAPAHLSLSAVGKLDFNAVNPHARQPT